VARLAELGRRELPVLLLAGERDGRYVDQARRIAATIGPSASVHVLAGAGHACHLECPAEVAEVMVAFLSPAEQGRRTGATVNTKGDRFPTLCGIARR